MTSGIKTRILLPVASLLVLSLALAGCSSTRQGQKGDLPGQLPADISLQTPQQRYSALCRSYTEWQDVTLPVKIAVTSPKSITLSGRASMERGKSINISVRMLGFEVASMLIDNDSIHVIDRYHKAYVSESIPHLFGGEKVSVTDLQDLLLGRGFVAGGGGGTFTPSLISAVDFEKAPEGLMILPARQPAGFEYGFILSPDLNRIAATSIAVGQAHGITVNYSSPEETPAGGAIAGVTAIRTVTGREMAAAIQWNYGSAKWNSGARNSWQTPKGYRRLDAASLISSLSKL